MIINHKYKFIFIKTSKTASTSLELALHEFCHAGDVITPLTHKLPQERRETLEQYYREKYPHYQPQNYFVPFKYYRHDDWMNLLCFDRLKYVNHTTAAELMMQCDPEIWQSYFKFCFTRNPWDRVLSHYFYTKHRVKQHDMTFAAYLENKHYLQQLQMKGYDAYTLNDIVIVDKVYKLEDLNQSLAEIQARCGLPNTIKIFHENSRQRNDGDDYRRYYHDEQRDYIHQEFHKEIKLFHYAF